MSDTNTGGWAFPAPAGCGEDNGMTLRDYFAAKALAVIYMEADDDDHSAQRAYEMADAMLKAREAK